MDKAKRIQALVERQASSGQSIKDFCAEAGISYATFHYWRRKSRTLRQAPSADVGFISLKCSPPPPEPAAAAAATLEVSLPGGLRLSISGIDPERLTDLLHRLDQRYA
ncbi:IS66 family insertion sequence element accessory protein TnpA, partial [Neolewinella litorea]|uniref:IS66 family insertion sequence element accessory protein TnpA n=1 Tax=Neolewinella litorea TaxID=2562452 RepID=UPI001455FD12